MGEKKEREKREQKKQLGDVGVKRKRLYVLFGKNDKNTSGKSPKEMSAFWEEILVNSLPFLPLGVAKKKGRGFAINRREPVKKQWE